MTTEQMFARATAYEEAAEHLRQSWTKDATERAQGDLVSITLQKWAEYWFARSAPKVISKVDGPLIDTGPNPTIASGGSTCHE